MYRVFFIYKPKKRAKEEKKMYMNKCEFSGYLGHKPEAKDAKGRAVMELSVGVGRKPKKGEKVGATDWIKFTVWDQPTIKYLSTYFDKGDEVFITCHYHTRKVVGADGTERMFENFIVDDIQKVTWKKPSGAGVSVQKADDSGIEVEDLGLTGEIPEDFE